MRVRSIFCIKLQSTGKNGSGSRKAYGTLTKLSGLSACRQLKDDLKDFSFRFSVKVWGLRQDAGRLFEESVRSERSALKPSGGCLGKVSSSVLEWPKSCCGLKEPARPITKTDLNLISCSDKKSEAAVSALV